MLMLLSFIGCGVAQPTGPAESPYADRRTALAELKRAEGHVKEPRKRDGFVLKSDPVDSVLVATASKKHVRFFRVWKDHVAAGMMVTLDSPISEMSWTPAGELAVLTQGRGAWLVSERGKTRLRLPAAQLFEPEGCQAYEDDDESSFECYCQERLDDHPTWRAHLVPTASGVWLADCVALDESSESCSDCLVWRYVAIDGRGTTRTDPPETTVRYEIVFQGVPRLRSDLLISGSLT